MVGDKWLEASAYFFGSGGRVGSEGNQTGSHEDFGTDGLIESLAAGCEGCGDGRVGMDDGLYIGTHAVDSEVHADLAGYVSGST